MTLSSRVAVAAATVAVAVGGATPAVAGSMSHWSKAKCKSYAKKYAKVKGSAMTKDNKTLKEHGCSQKVK